MKLQNSTYFFAFILIAITSCKTEVPIVHQKILFEQHYMNYAWGYQNKGYLIDSLGNVRTFDISKDTVKWNEADKERSISAAKLAQNIALCTSIVYQINHDTLSFYSGKIEAASKGKVSEPLNQMADAGSNVFSAFMYDEKTNSYKKIMLKTWGDWTINNDSPEAESIYSWMVRLTTQNNTITQLKYGTSFGNVLDIVNTM